MIDVVGYVKVGMGYQCNVSSVHSPEVLAVIRKDNYSPEINRSLITTIHFNYALLLLNFFYRAQSHTQNLCESEVYHVF